MARTKKQSSAAAEPELDQPRIDDAAAEMRRSATADRIAQDMELYDLGRQVGAIQMGRIQTNVVAAATLRLFQQIKESNKFKDLPIRREDGSVAAATNLREFCDLVFGVGYEKMLENSQTLDALGQDAYNAATRLGLNRSQLRAVRALPPDKMDAVRAAIQDGTKAEVLAVIEDLAAKLSEQEAANAELRAEAAAEARVRSDLHEKLDKVNTKLRRIPRLPANERISLLTEEAQRMATEAELFVRRLGPAIDELRKIEESEGVDLGVFKAGLVGQVKCAVEQVRQTFGLPDVSNAAELEQLKEIAAWNK